MLKTNSGYWNDKAFKKPNFLIDSLDTGLLAMEHYTMEGGLFENGNYSVLPLSPIDSLICSYKEEKLNNQEIVEELIKVLHEKGIKFDYEINLDFVQSRIQAIYEMYNSFCSSYSYSINYRQSHPYRRG